MTRTQRALVVLVPLALVLIVLTKWLWFLYLIILTSILGGAIGFGLVALAFGAYHWIKYGEWEWPWD